jgi:hypothetical protein
MTQRRVDQLDVAGWFVLVRNQGNNSPGTGHISSFLSIQEINHLPKIM